MLFVALDDILKRGHLLGFRKLHETSGFAIGQQVNAIAVLQDLERNYTFYIEMENILHTPNMYIFVLRHHNHSFSHFEKFIGDGLKGVGNIHFCVERT